MIEYLKKNWIKVLLLVAAGIFVLDGYGVNDTFQIVAVLVCMFLTILNIVEIYIEVKHYILFKELAISKGRIAFLIVSSLGIVSLVLFILSQKSIIFSFSFAGLVLLVLLIYEVFLIQGRGND